MFRLLVHPLLRILWRVLSLLRQTVFGVEVETRLEEIFQSFQDQGTSCVFDFGMFWDLKLFCRLFFINANQTQSWFWVSGSFWVI